MADNLTPFPKKPQIGGEDHFRHSRQIEPLISLYQDGEASRSEIELVEQYLQSCPECRAIYTEYEQIGEQLRGFMGAIPEPQLTLDDYNFLPGRAETVQAEPLRRVRPERPRLLPNLEATSSARQQPVRPTRRSAFTSLASLATAAALVLAVTLFLIGVQLGPSNPKITTTTDVGQLASPSVVATEEVTPTTEAMTAPPETTSAPETTVAPVATTPPVALTTQSAVNPATTEANQYTQPVQATTQAPPTQVAVQATPKPTPRPQPTATPTPVPPTTVALPKNTTAPAVPSIDAATTAPVTTAAPTTVPATTQVAPVTTVAPTTTAAPTTEPVATVAPSTSPAGIAPIAPNTPVTSVPTPAGIGPDSYGLIAYVDRTDGQIHLVALDGSNDQVVGDAVGLKGITWEQLVWSNDARWLAAVGLQSAKNQHTIYLIDSQNPRQIVSVTDGIAPVWSPDSRTLAFLAAPITIQGGLPVGQPATLDLKKRSFTIRSTTPQNFPPQWFDSGDRLLLGQDTILDLNSSQTSTFKVFENDCVGDSLSPAGNRLAVLNQTSDGRFETVIYDLNKGQPGEKTVLVRVAAPVQGKVGVTCGATRLSWTADSRNVYYYTTDANGSPTTCLISTAGNSRCLSNVYAPSFTLDSAYFADYSPTSGLVYVGVTSSTGRAANPHSIAEATFPPVWQPR